MNFGQYVMIILSLLLALTVVLMAVELNDKTKEVDEAHRLNQELRASKAAGWNINF